MNDNFKSGFATLIGRPNVGKSTLMNRLIGQKIAITSNKPQTTRNRIQTVLTTEDGQIVFVDTPGIHRQRTSWASIWSMWRSGRSMKWMWCSVAGAVHVYRGGGTAHP